MNGETLYAWIAFSMYAMTIAGIAIWSRARARSMETFSVGTRTVSPYFVGLSLAANMASAATFVINPGLMYLYGWAGIVGYAIATPLGIFLALIVISKKFRSIGDRTRVITVPQWIGDRFGARSLTVYFSVLSLLQITFLVLIVVGLAVVLRSTLGISIETALLVVVGFTFGYIVLGGASAHILTNTIQAIIMIVVAILFITSGLEFFGGDGGGFFARLGEVAPHFGSATNPDSALFRDWFEVFAANFIIGIAIILQPHIISKSLYLRTERDVNRYLATAIIVATLFFAVLLTGLYARLTLGGEVLKPDMVIATYIVHEFSPPLRALIGLGILSAGFSTLEGILLALSSIFANDFLRSVLPTRLTESEEWKTRSLRYAKIFLVALAPITLLLSWDQILHPSISVALFAQNGVYGLFAATFVPVLFGVFTRRATKEMVFAASLLALGVHFGMYYGELTKYHNNPAVTAACALIASVAFMLIMMAFAKSTPQQPVPLERAK
ncbi:MAG: sodium:solute symporter family protein [Bacteroidetes bacterium]|nr:sodium:solute symporter family protein [Bacteroidota bacterium]